jgi:integrase
LHFRSQDSRYAWQAGAGGAYDIADVERMLEDITDETTQDVITLLSFTGLRAGEARGLRWSDWNEKEETLTISRGVWRNKVGPTKNVASEGEIPVLPLLKDLLENRRTRIKPTPKPSDYIFAGVRRGAPLDFHNLENRIIRPALKNTPVKWVGFHGFRRGLASNLFSMGVNPRIIAGILRHSGLATALAHYIKTPPEESRAAMLKLEERIRTYGQQDIIRQNGDPN